MEASAYYQAHQGEAIDKRDTLISVSTSKKAISIMNKWILELSRLSDRSIPREHTSRYEPVCIANIYTHIGYLNIGFTTREKACQFVDKALPPDIVASRTNTTPKSATSWESLTTNEGVRITLRKFSVEELTIDARGRWWRLPPIVTYMLEAQAYMDRGFQHVGYVAWSWYTKEEAADFYDRMYPKMRGLNAFGTWISDWSPKDGLRYVVRPWNDEYIEIDTCREVIEGQKEVLIKLNREVRLENGKPIDY